MKIIIIGFFLISWAILIYWNNEKKEILLYENVIYVPLSLEAAS